MTALANTSKDYVVQFFFRTGTPTKPSAYHIALFTVKPADDGTGGTEVSTSGTGYARVQYDPSDANWSARDANDKTHNLAQISFATPTGSGGTVVAWGAYSASTGGTLYLVGDLTTSRLWASGNPAMYFDISDLEATVG